MHETALHKQVPMWLLHSSTPLSGSVNVSPPSGVTLHISVVKLHTLELLPGRHEP